MRQSERGSADAGAAGRAWWQHLAWVGVLAAVGFAVPAVFVGAFRIPRPWYLPFHFAAVAGVACGYAPHY